jgi:hypothetical protein
MKLTVVTIPFMSIGLSDKSITIAIDGALNLSEDKIKENIFKKLCNNKDFYPFLECIEFDMEKFTIEMNNHQDGIVMHVDEPLLSRIQYIQAELTLQEIKNRASLLISLDKECLINLSQIEKKFRKIEPYLSEPSKIEAKTLLEKYQPIFNDINKQFVACKTLEETIRVCNETNTFFKKPNMEPARDILKEMEEHMEEMKNKYKTSDKQQLPPSCGMEFIKNEFK